MTNPKNPVFSPTATTAQVYDPRRKVSNVSCSSSASSRKKPRKEARIRRRAAQAATS
jgi:hypothetical protein